MTFKQLLKTPVALGLLLAITLATLSVFVGDLAAQAQVVNSTAVQSSLRNERLVGNVDASAVPQNFATTSYADLTGASVSFTAQVDPTVSAYFGGPLRTDLIRVIFTADVSKATATTGNCALFVNGAIVTKTARYVASAAGRSGIAIDYTIPNTTAGTQTVKVQCQSADTNAFTVTNANLQVLERW